jgi:hypothetical protein
MNKIVVIFCLFLSWVSYSQDIYIIVKRGSATLDNEPLTAEKGVRKMGEKSKLILSENTLVLVKQNKKLIQIIEPRGFKKSQILQLLAKQNEFSTSSYFSVLFTEKMQKPAPVIQSGSVTRGGSDVNWHDIRCLPLSGATLMSDTLKITILNDGVGLADSITLISLETEKMTSLVLNENGLCVINGLEQGYYEWNLPLTATDESISDKTYVFRDKIRIPSEEQQANMRAQFDEFLKTISIYEPEIQEILKSEFYAIKNWCP